MYCQNKVFMYWHSDNIPTQYKECIENNKNLCSHLEYVLYNNNSARNYIKNNYSQDHLYTYDKLKPYAFKSDFWRLCILNKEGGIYSDLKIKFTQKFKPWLKNHQIENINKGILLEDHQNGAEILPDNKRNLALQNAFIISNKNNAFLSLTINEIISNVKNNYYGQIPLSVTGPALLGRLYKTNKINNFRILPLSYWHNLINFNKNYQVLQSRCTEQPHYHYMWHNKDIYNNI